MIGYSRRTSAAAFRPSSTSCSGVYLFFGGLTVVCASRPAAETNNAIVNADAHAFLIAMMCSFETFAPLSRRGRRIPYCAHLRRATTASASTPGDARRALHGGGGMAAEARLQRPHDRLAD